MCLIRRNLNGNCGVNIRPSTRLGIYLRDGVRCIWCRRDLSESLSELSLDHLVPHEFGGNNSGGNLVTACRSCNCSRKEEPWELFCKKWRGSKIRVVRAISLEVPRELARMVLFGVVNRMDAVKSMRKINRWR